jgi:hypothetical protein
MSEGSAPPASRDLSPHVTRPAGTPPRSVIASLRARLEWIREFFTPAPVAGASLVLSLIAGLLLAVPDQMRESLRILGESWLRIIAFLAATLLASLTAWYWARVMTYRLMPRAWEQKPGSPLRHGMGTFPRLAGVLPALFAALGVVFAARIDTSAERDLVIRLYIVSALLVMMAAGLLFAYWRRRVLLDKASAGGQTSGVAPAGYSKPARIVLAVVGILSVILGIAVTVNPVGVVGWSWMNPATLLQLATASWIAFISALVYYGRKHRWPYVWTLIVGSVLFTWLNFNDNHEIRYLPQRSGGDARLGDAFGAWLAQRADRSAGGAAYPVFLIAAEGGGIRAAYITAQILATIQDHCPAFAQHVFAVSGVSGGSLGAAVFAGLTARHARNEPNLPCNVLGVTPPTTMRGPADSVLAHDFLTPVTGMAVYPDLLQRFLPVSFGVFDRARALEDGFTRAWREAFPDGWGFDSSFYNLRRGDASAVPALFLNVTQVENGARVVITNLSPDSTVAGRLTTLSSLDSTINLSMSTAVSLSARFTYITPEGAISFASGARQRFVDGGYFENSGAGTILDVIHAIRAWERSHRDGSRPRVRPIILRVGYSEGVDSTRARIDNSGFSDALSPIFALLNTRGTRGTVVVEQLRAAVDQAHGDAVEMNMLDLVLTRGRVPLILGWLLSETARADVRARTSAEPCAPDAPVAGRVIRTATPEDSWLRAGYCAVFGEISAFRRGSASVVPLQPREDGPVR